MILTLGRPGLDQRGQLDRTPGRVALAAAAAGARVELVGSIGDDGDGDAVVIALGRAGIGHAALLRDPAGVTPRAGTAEGPLPRLDARDVELALRYLPDCRVLVVAEPLDEDTQRVVAAAAEYHGAALVTVVQAGTGTPRGTPPAATVLELPERDEGAFASLVGRYAAGLAAGRPAADAWHDAISASGWEEMPL